MPPMDTPNIDEFIAHPDYQQISSFFLGAVFVTSLNYSYLWIRGFSPRFWGWVSRNRSISTDVENLDPEKGSIVSSSTLVRPAENQSLVFTLSLCFVFTSVAYFGSLLSYSSNGGAICAFVVAWGGMAAQTARIIGLVIILFELRDLGIPRLEFYAAFTWLFIAMVLVFVNNAISTGAIRFFPPLKIAICYRKHFVPTALATSLIYLAVELFVFFRLKFLIMRQSTPPRQLLASWKDSRVVKALSLLFLEMLTIGPSATHISLLADFIPLSIGALAVLVSFNSAPTTRYKTISDPVAVSPISVVPTPPVVRAGWLRRSFGSSFNRSNMTSASASPQPVPATIPHPFAAQYLNETNVAWPRHDQQQTSRLSIVETMMRTHEGDIEPIKRSGIPVGRARADAKSSANAPLVPKNMSHQPFDVPPLEKSAAKNPVAGSHSEMQSPAISPASILMHPWHERVQGDSARLTSRFSVDGSEELKTTRSRLSKASDRSSDMFKGYAFPKPPVPSPPGHMRRYSSATLTSPLFSQEGSDTRRSGQHVKLITFESTFRGNGGEKISYRTPLPSASSSGTSR